MQSATITPRPGDERRITTPRLTHHILDWPGSAPPIVLIHPNRTLNRVWDFVVASSALPNRFVAPGLRGHGLSDYPVAGYTLEAHRDDLLACLDALAIDRAILVGQATGATLAMMMASARPSLAIGVVAAQPAFGIPGAVNDLVQRQVAAQTRLASREAAKNALPFSERWSTQIAEHYLDHALAPLADGGFAWRYFAPGVAATEAELTRDLLDDVRYGGPALVFGGAESTVLPQSMFDRVAAHLPSARRASLANANHRLSQDNPRGFATLVDEFVTTSCAAASSPR